MSPLMEVRGLGVEMGGRLIVDDLDLQVRPGRVTGLVGPSGSGKTTILRALAGLIPASSGSVVHTARRDGIAMMAQHPRQVCNPRWTLRRIVVEPAVVAGRSADAEAVARRVGLDPDLLDRYPGQVSDGQLQRACLARLTVQAPDIVLADEPTAMLDPVSAQAVIEVIADLAAAGAGVVLVSHHRGLVRVFCDEVIDLGDREPAGSAGA